MLAQTAPGFSLEIYASVDDPAWMSFDSSSGDLYVGACVAASSTIHRIVSGGFPVMDYGPLIVDPDAVLFDRNGCISGIPGAVLVGDGFEAGSGQVLAILPDQSCFSLFSNIFAANPADMAVDSLGRLVMLNDLGGGRGGNVLVSSGDSLAPLYALPDRGGSLAIDGQDNIYTLGRDGIIRVHDSGGGEINPQLGPSLGSSSLLPLAIGPGGEPWDSDVYTISLAGQLLRIDPETERVRVLGRGFDGIYFDAEFGPDEALYLSHFTGGRIVRLRPLEKDRKRAFR